MGQNQRRPGFLRWGEGTREADADAGAEAAVPATSDETASPEAAAADTEKPADATADSADVKAEAAPAAEEAADANGTDAADGADVAAAGSDANPFLRDLVGAMRGVADSSRESTVAEFRSSVDARIEELKAAATQRADELRRRSELDLGGIGDWERSELERVRAEAEQRRKARRELLEKELAEHQGASDRELEALNARLDDYERQLDAFFAKLDDVTDPAEFVATAKQMPAPPDLSAPAGAKSAKAETANGNGASPTPEDRLARRLAQLDEKLGTATATAPAATPTPAPVEAAAAAPAADEASAETTTSATPAAIAPAEQAAPATAGTATATATAAPAAETSTPIVVKGLGSFGAITSFKQALERVDGIHGVTLSLGPTGDFVYRASHADDFDLVTAIRSIEGPNAEIEEVDGQLRVTIERPR